MATRPPFLWACWAHRPRSGRRRFVQMQSRPPRRRAPRSAFAGVAARTRRPLPLPARAVRRLCAPPAGCRAPRRGPAQPSAYANRSPMARRGAPAFLPLPCPPPLSRLSVSLSSPYPLPFPLSRPCCALSLRLHTARPSRRAGARKHCIVQGRTQRRPRPARGPARRPACGGLLHTRRRVVSPLRAGRGPARAVLRPGVPPSPAWQPLAVSFTKASVFVFLARVRGPSVVWGCRARRCPPCGWEGPVAARLPGGWRRRRGHLAAHSRLKNPSRAPVPLVAQKQQTVYS
jgi:hypothetical protein